MNRRTLRPKAGRNKAHYRIPAALLAQVSADYRGSARKRLMANAK
jgi:hypothetical protein